MPQFATQAFSEKYYFTLFFSHFIPPQWPAYCYWYRQQACRSCSCSLPFDLTLRDKFLFNWKSNARAWEKPTRATEYIQNVQTHLYQTFVEEKLVRFNINYKPWCEGWTKSLPLFIWTLLLTHLLLGSSEVDIVVSVAVTFCDLKWPSLSSAEPSALRGALSGMCVCGTAFARSCVFVRAYNQTYKCHAVHWL